MPASLPWVPWLQQARKDHLPEQQQPAFLAPVEARPMPESEPRNREATQKGHLSQSEVRWGKQRAQVSVVLAAEPRKRAVAWAELPSSASVLPHVLLEPGETARVEECLAEP